MEMKITGLKDLLKLLHEFQMSEDNSPEEESIAVEIFKMFHWPQSDEDIMQLGMAVTDSLFIGREAMCPEGLGDNE